MDEASWPTDRRQLRKDGQTKGKGKAKAVKTIRDYPYLDYGLLNALTLSPDNGRLKWSTITGTTKGNLCFSCSFASDIKLRKKVGARRGPCKDIPCDSSLASADAKSLSIPTRRTGGAGSLFYLFS